MSDKKKTAWDDLVGGSDLPADDFTWTDGSNYGMDGFSFTQTMNEGVLNHGDQSGLAGPMIHQQSKGLSQLPDGIVSTDMEDVSFVDTDPLQITEDGIDLSTMLSEDEGALHLAAKVQEVAGLADLSWLDPTQEQDPERLPKELLPDRPPLHSLPELEDAWGVDHRTDGVYLVPNRDREAIKYEESISGPPPAVPGARPEPHDFKQSVLKAGRRIHYGHSPQDVRQGVVDALGHHASEVQGSVKRLEQDYGLAGTVFVRASLFPGIKNGRWVKELKRVVKTARYVITDDQTVATKLGMQMVSEVPWKEALAHYAPRLKAAGYRIASGDPREVLRQAFLNGPMAPKVATGHKPVVIPDADRVSTQDAQDALRASKKKAREVVPSLEKRSLKVKMGAVRAHIDKLHQAGQLTDDEAVKLATSKVAPHLIRRTAAQLVAAPMVPGMYGAGIGQPHTWNQQSARAQVMSRFTQEDVLAAQEAKVEANLQRHVRSGNLTTDEAQRIKGMGLGPHRTAQLIAAAVQHAPARRKLIAKMEEVKEFSGPRFKHHHQRTTTTGKLATEDEAFHRVAKEHGFQVIEIKKLARWARQQMSEGVMGAEFTELLKMRWASDLLRASAPIIRDLRATHEGLSGNLYVDAAAYASSKGVKGCEKAALKHRANQVRTVMAMDRCASCVHAREGQCSLYKKPLVASVGDLTGDPQALQKRAIKMADAPDAEVTASLFNPGDFNLQSPLDGAFNLDNAPDSGTLGEVLFGDGMHLGD